MANSKLAFGLVGTGYSKGWVGSISITGSKTNVAVDYIDTSGDMTTDPRVLPISVTGTLRTLVNSYDYGGVGELGQQGRGLYL